MTIYKDVNGREFTYNEYWNKIYLDEKRPHVDHLIRHKWPEEKPEKGQYLVARRYKYGDGKLQFTLASYWFDQRYDGEVYSPESEGADKWGYIKNPKKIEMCWMENSDDGCRDMSDEVVYWWNLPEVTE